jgi:chromosome segregation ATPase
MIFLGGVPILRKTYLIRDPAMTPRQALFAAVLIDYDRRQRNYHEFKERMEGNIRRWEESLEKNEGFQRRTAATIEKNEERLRKAQEALERRTSGNTMDWLERQRVIASTHRAEAARLAASEKIRDHEAKVRDIQHSIDQMHQWIERGRNDLRDARRKASELESKISDARGKI